MDHDVEIDWQFFKKARKQNQCVLTFICPGLWVEIWKLDLQRFQGGKYFFLVSFYYFHHFLSQKLLFEIENLWNEQSSLVFASVGLEADEPMQDLQTKLYISYVSIISLYCKWTWSRHDSAGLANKIIYSIIFHIISYYIFFRRSWTWNRRGTLQDLLSTNKTANGIS